MKIVCFIPLRKQSKRVLDKNNQLIGGRNLVSHITSSVVKCHAINSFYLYTSSKEYLEDADQNFQLLGRDPMLDRDETVGMDIYKSFASIVTADIYVLVHATSPFLSSQTLQLGLDSVISGDYDSAFSVARVQTFAWFNGKPLNYEFANIPRTQDIEPLFYETSSFYIFRQDVLRKGIRIGENPKMIELSGMEAIDIDEPDDLELARSYWHSQHN